MPEAAGVAGCPGLLPLADVVDQAVVLGLLAVVVAVDTAAILAILGLTLRGRASAGHQHSPSAAAVAPSAGSGPIDEPVLAGAEGTARVVGPARAGPSAPVPAGTDQLADAITAFLGRSEGIFRAGGSPATPTLADAAPAPLLDSPGPEVTWSPSRPARYVPSGPRPARPVDRPAPMTAGRARDGAPPPANVSTGGGSPSSADAIDPAEPLAARPQPVSAPARPAIRLRVALAAREPSDRVVAVETLARVGPVIGGLLRERTRGRDRVEPDGPGRYSVVLPDTSRDGAEVLGRRIATSCDDWLAAELPPLWLELRLDDQPVGVPLAAPEPRREPGTERRRQVSQDA